MIKVTIFYEHLQDQGAKALDVMFSEEQKKDPRMQFFKDFLEKSSAEMIKVHPNGIDGTLAEFLGAEEDIQVRCARLEMPECGLTQEVLDDTDVLLWWAHIGHELVPDDIARRVQTRVLNGMGFIPLHSSHQCKPLQMLLGTSGALQWREGDFCRVWNVSPTSPITQGVPLSFELEEEEMYGEFFDIPAPDDLVFVSWYSGGEIFRSGCCWKRGYGRIFYFQPGHETDRAYYNPIVRRIILNAIRWAKPTTTRAAIECPEAKISPEARRKGEVK